MNLALEPIQLEVCAPADSLATVRQAMIHLRAGSPVTVFCRMNDATTLGFRAKPVTGGVFMVSADVRKTGTWTSVDTLMPAALGAVERAFQNMDGMADRR